MNFRLIFQSVKLKDKKVTWGEIKGKNKLSVQMATAEAVLREAHYNTTSPK